MRRRRRGRDDILAVPLTPDETALLVNALRENDRLHRIHFWTHDGEAWSRHEAGAVMRMADTAAALGHGAVPVLVQELHMYELVLSGLQKYAPGTATMPRSAGACGLPAARAAAR